jgi:nucleotide-binding universal stress UspA family protein
MTDHSGYQRIVVPLDRSERAEAALPVARSLATAFGARIELVHVSMADPPSDDEVAYLDAVASSLVSEDVVTRVEHGWPVPVLVDLVRASPDALLCLAASARTGLSGLLLGSVADELLPDVTSPVVLVGRDYDAPAAPRLDLGAGHLVVCTDGSDESQSIASLARTWARTLGLDIRVVMVLHREGRFLGNEDAARPRERAAAFTEALRAQGLTAELELLEGIDPARAIASYAASLPATLVMTSTHGQGGLLRTALGSVALRISNRAPCPVVIQRSPDPGHC